MTFWVWMSIAAFMGYQLGVGIGYDKCLADEIDTSSFVDDLFNKSKEEYLERQKVRDQFNKDNTEMKILLRTLSGQKCLKL